MDFCHLLCLYTRAKSNMQFVVSNPKVEEVVLAREVEKGRVIGQFELDALPEFHVSCFICDPQQPLCRQMEADCGIIAPRRSEC